MVNDNRTCIILTGKTAGKKSFGRPRCDEKTILKWILHRLDVHLIDLSQNSGPVAGSSDYGNELWVFTEGNGSPDQFRDFLAFQAALVNFTLRPCPWSDNVPSSQLTNHSLRVSWKFSHRTRVSDAPGKKRRWFYGDVTRTRGRYKSSLSHEVNP